MLLIFSDLYDFPSFLKLLQSQPNRELGYGSAGPKSSANPKLIDSLAGKMVRQVAMGLGHSLFLIDAEDAADLPVYTPAELDPAAAVAPVTAAKGKRKPAPAKGPKKKAPKKK